MKKHRRHLRTLHTSNDGVAGVVVALLLVGLIFSALALIQTVYVPQWMKEKEAEHMDMVANQFSQFKFSIDTLSILKTENTALSTPITLGSKELPFLVSSKAYGSIEIIPDEFKINITNDKGENTSYTLGALKYTSDNAYYLEQIYIYEAGGVILNQNSGEIVFIQPSIFITSTNDLSFSLVKIIPTGEKTSASGYGTYPVQMKFLKEETLNIYDIEKITIYNSHLKAWYSYFDNLLKNYNKFDSIQHTPSGDGIIIKFSPDPSDPTDDLPNLELHITEINLQISPGWIK